MVGDTVSVFTQLKSQLVRSEDDGSSSKRHINTNTPCYSDRTVSAPLEVKVPRSEVSEEMFYSLHTLMSEL